MVFFGYIELYAIPIKILLEIYYGHIIPILYFPIHCIIFQICYLKDVQWTWVMAVLNHSICLPAPPPSFSLDHPSSSPSPFVIIVLQKAGGGAKGRGGATNQEPRTPVCTFWEAVYCVAWEATPLLLSLSLSHTYMHAYIFALFLSFPGSLALT